MSTANPSAPVILEPGLYGPRGWTVSAGVWDVLADYPGLHPERTPVSCGLPQGRIQDGKPVDDYTPFHDLGPQAAARLLQILPAEQLEDRQNLSPTLGAMLRACVKAEGRVRLSGYGIGPQRADERIAVEALWIADPDLLEMELHATHDAGCQCSELWDAVRERCDLDAVCMPDEIRKVSRRPNEGPTGMWMWWD